jgi:hypothetical protein
MDPRRIAELSGSSTVFLDRLLCGRIRNVMVSKELLWTRADELPDPQAVTGLLGILIESGRLDQAKATAWGFVALSTTGSGPGNGLAIDPLRCRRVASALLGCLS